MLAAVEQQTTVFTQSQRQPCRWEDEHQRSNVNCQTGEYDEQLLQLMPCLVLFNNRSQSWRSGGASPADRNGQCLLSATKRRFVRL
jgi:hypothetical protein